MIQRINPLTKRIDEFIKYKMMSVRAFEHSIGASDGLLRRAIKQDTDICSVWIFSLAKTYPELSLEWLLRGNGAMIRNTIPNSTKTGIKAQYRELQKLDRKLHTQLNKLKYHSPKLYLELNQND